MAGDWETTGTDAPQQPATPRLWLRCTCPKHCERYTRLGTPCYHGGTFATPVEVASGGMATHGHPPTSLGYLVRDYEPPSVEELRQYEGPHD